MRIRRQTLAGLLLMLTITVGSADCGIAEDKQKLSALAEVTVTSSLDGEEQPVLFWAPESAESKLTPMLVFLHSWSSNYKQKNDAWQREAEQRGWIYLHPDFRGPNKTPKACGSKFARQDILDAMTFAQKQFMVDPERVYLAGTSGGGHMSMLMAGHHPEKFSAVSAWVGISDLAEWYQFHTKDGKRGRYAQMIVDSLGSAPGSDRKRDLEYRDRSPVFHLHHVGDLPVDLFAGVRDGKTGSVPIMHTLNAFNVIAKSHSTVPIAEAEISELWTNGKLKTPSESDEANDKELTREILLRRKSRKSRVTIFDGGHEGLAAPACAWLNRQSRLTE